MRMNSKLDDLLSQGRSAEATSLLENHLAAAEIIDPSNDKSWAPYADQISFKILTDKGQDASIAFWQELLNFFVKDLEPKWGHLHKGHILFRLGLAMLSNDMSTAKKHIQEALDEDRLLEKKRSWGKSVDVEKSIRPYSSYVTLCIIERIEDEDFESDIEKQKFFSEFFSTSFDAAIMRREVNQILVEKAVNRIVPQEGLEQALGIKRELDLAFERRLPIATVSLAGAFLESVLLSILYYKTSLRIVEGNDILGIQLGKLLREASKKGVFPSDAIRATCQVIHIFRNRLHPGNELRQRYKLTDRVAATLKILLDLALLEWERRAG
jgi:hypothetical protein